MLISLYRASCANVQKFLFKATQRPNTFCQENQKYFRLSIDAEILRGATSSYLLGAYENIQGIRFSVSFCNRLVADSFGDELCF